MVYLIHQEVKILGKEEFIREYFKIQEWIKWDKSLI